MIHSNNGGSASGNGVAPKPDSSVSRCPRRVVLLCDGEASDMERVLRDYQGTEVSGKRLHADLHALADEHRGRYVAGEWLGSLGWTRFLWCRR